MAKQLTITIDFSDRRSDTHGDREVSPTMNINAHGLGSEQEAAMIAKITDAVMKIIKPKPLP